MKLLTVPTAAFLAALCLTALIGTPGVRAAANDPVIGHDDVPLYLRSNRWRCDVTSKFFCFDDICRRFSVTGKDNVRRYWMELDFAQHSYTRCDQNGCDRKEVGTSTAGAFTLVEPGDGAFMKITNGSGEFVDVATMGTGLAASFGTCVPEDR